MNSANINRKNERMRRDIANINPAIPAVDVAKRIVDGQRLRYAGNGSINIDQVAQDCDMVRFVRASAIKGAAILGEARDIVRACAVIGGRLRREGMRRTSMSVSPSLSIT